MESSYCQQAVTFFCLQFTAGLAPSLFGLLHHPWEKSKNWTLKEQDLNVLKDITEELIDKVEMLQQQFAVQEIERLNKELEARKSSVKDLWKTNCEQLNEFDQAMLAKDEELQSLRSLLPSKSQSTYIMGNLLNF